MLIVRVCTILALCLSTYTSASAQKLLVGVDGASAKVVGNGIENLRIGWALAGNVFYSLNNVFWVGGRVAHVRWAPVESAFSDQISGTKNVDVSGSIWTIEILPEIRAQTNFTNNVVNLFAQLGVGAYIANSQIKVKGTTTNSLGVTTPVDTTFGKEKNGNFGVAVGGGVTIGKAGPVMVQMYPVVNIIVRDDTPKAYLTFNAGIVFGF
jgi:hypothetical protein